MLSEGARYTQEEANTDKAELMALITANAEQIKLLSQREQALEDHFSRLELPPAWFKAQVDKMQSTVEENRELIIEIRADVRALRNGGN